MEINVLYYQLFLQPVDNNKLISPLQSHFDKMHLGSKLKENYDSFGSVIEDLETDYVVIEESSL